MTDKYGNFISYYYHENTVTGESYPIRIEYTGNGSMLPYHRIQFNYFDRYDPQTSYVHGSIVSKTKLLENIVVTHEGNLVKEYRLKYFHDNVSKLNEIVEAGPDNSQYNSIVLGWPENEITVNEQSPTMNMSPLKRIYRDFNGDGRTDFVLVGTNTFDLYLANSTSIGFTLKYTGGLPAGFVNFDAGDYNGDGLADLLCLKTDNGDFINTLLESTGESFITKSSNNCSISNGFSFGDFNGDGKREILVRSEYHPISHPAYTNHWLCYTFDDADNSWHGRVIYFEPDFVWDPETYYFATDERVIDMNGDGKDDIVMLSDYGIGVIDINANDSLSVVL